MRCPAGSRGRTLNPDTPKISSNGLEPAQPNWGAAQRYPNFCLSKDWGCCSGTVPAPTPQIDAVANAGLCHGAWPHLVLLQLQGWRSLEKTVLLTTAGLHRTQPAPRRVWARWEAG